MMVNVYNSAQKEAFLRCCYSADTSFENHMRFFQQTAIVESKLNKDLCFMNHDELDLVFAEINGLRSTSWRGRVSCLKSYGRWCKENVSGANDCLITFKYGVNCNANNRMVGSPLQLQMYLNSICEPESSEETDNVYRCYYWLAFAGIPESDIIRIEPKHVNLKKMRIEYKGKVFPIYKESLAAFKNCINLDNFVYSHPNYKSKIRRQRVPGSQIVRGVRGEPSVYNFRAELSRRSKKKIAEGKTNLELSYYRVWISGLYYQMCVKEAMGEPVDFTDVSMYGKYIRESLEEAERYKATVTNDSLNVKVLRRDYLRDYNTWKSYFC